MTTVWNKSTGAIRGAAVVRSSRGTRGAVFQSTRATDAPNGRGICAAAVLRTFRGWQV